MKGTDGMGMRQDVAASAKWRATAHHAPKLMAKTIALSWPPNLAVVARNVAARRQSRPWLDFVERNDGMPFLRSALDDAIDWLCHSHARTTRGGVACYEFYRWTPGYPEVTGYVIPTFWDCASALGRPELAAHALQMAEWELSVQRQDGGWEGGYQGDGKPSTVFNTGQVIRGLLRTWSETGDDRYLEAAERGGAWIVANQEGDGSWARANFKGMRRVYDSYVSAALVRLGVATGDERFRLAAVRNCEFVLANQRANGWFANADNSPYSNDVPVTHTICYTIDGLLECGALLDEVAFHDAGQLAADALIRRVESWPMLYGRLDAEWQPRVDWVCLTGAAQLGVVALCLHDRTGDVRYLDAARTLVDFLTWTQQLNGVGRHRRGAIAGAYPIWGLYCPLKYPSWATKYFVDLTLRLTFRTQAAVAGRCVLA
jgi:hypothetical protein